MPIRPAQLAALMREVELEDPIDFADLPFPEDELRDLVASHLCEMAAAMENFSQEDRLMTLLPSRPSWCWKTSCCTCSYCGGMACR